MTDPVRTQGESEGTPVSAPPPPTPVQLPEVTVEAPAASPAPVTPETPATPPTAPVPAPEAPPAAPLEPVQQGDYRQVSTNATVVPAVPGKAPAPMKEKRLVDAMVPETTFKMDVQIPATNNVWEPDLERSAASTGVDVNLMRRIIRPESGGDVNAKNPMSTAAGLFQITKGTWAGLARQHPELNLTNRLDPSQQARVAPYYMREIQDHLTVQLGHKPNAAESYLGWFLGPQGAALALKANPDTPVERVISPDALGANASVFSKARTVGQLYAWAGGKMGDSSGAQHPQPKIDLTPYLAQGHDREHLDKMDWDLKSRLANMVADMPENLRAKFQINSGYRSPERQAELFKQAVAKYGSEEAARKWVAPPGNSMHNHGKAADLNMNGDPELKTWLHANAAKYGLGFPMGHEPWHIEALGARETKMARMGAYPGAHGSTSMPVRFTHQDDLDAERQRQNDSYSLIQAARATASQDWMVSNMLRRNGNEKYDPAFSINADTFNRPDVKSLPENFLPYIADARSAQDLDWRVKQAAESQERERKLANSGLTGTAMRIAVNMFDPVALGIGAVAPAGFVANMYKAGRVARFGAAAADGAIGSLAAEVPSMVNKPGYEASEALSTALMGTAGYLALTRGGRAPHVAHEFDVAAKRMDELRKDIESGNPSYGDGSAGAAMVAGARDAIRTDTADFGALTTEKTALTGLRFDFAKMKNSGNQMVAKVADMFGMDTVGNINRDKAITRPIEDNARMMEARPSVAMARVREVAHLDYRKRNGIGWREWNWGGKREEFEASASAYVRNTDPLVEFDPAVKQYGDAFTKTAGYWRELARNPGKLLGVEMRELPGASHWLDDPNWLPRYTDWNKFNTLHIQHGNQLRRLFGEAIHAKNPDLEKDFSFRLGDFYYNRLASVNAGQELTVQKALSGTDMDVLRRMLGEDGFGPEEIERALHQIDKNLESTGGKTMTSRQKPRTLMDENFRMQLNGKDVGVADIWEDNLTSISNAYNKQMSGAIAMAQFRIENPNFRPPKIEKRKIKEKVARQIEEEIEVPPKEPTTKVAREVEEVVERPGKPVDPFTTEERILIAAHTMKGRRGSADLKSLRAALPDLSKEEMDNALLALQKDGKGILSGYSDNKRAAQHAADALNRGETFHVFRPSAPSPTRTPNPPFKEIVKRIEYDEVKNPSTKEKRLKTVYDEIEKEVEEIIDNGTPKYLVDGIHSDGDWQKLLAQIRAHDVDIRPGDGRRTVEAEIKQLQWMYDTIRGIPMDGDRTKLGQFARVVQNVNFIRLMSQAGASSIAEFGNLLGQIGLKHTLKAIPSFSEFIRDAKTGKLLRDDLEDFEYIFTAGTDHLRGSGASWTARDTASALNDGSQMSAYLDKAEAVTKKLTRYTSMVSLAPITILQERMAQKAVLSKFRGAAIDGDKLSAKRMRLLGLDQEMQDRVLAEIKKHDEYVIGENGKRVRILGLEKWEPQVRSSFEFAVQTWVRRIIQQNDHGQMNAMMSTPMAKLLTQFRTFTIGAWSKQTLSSIHMRDGEATIGFLASMVFGSVAYAAQSAFQGIGLTGEDWDKFAKDRFSEKKLLASAIQRAGASSLLPGVYDTVTTGLGFDPLFNTRSSQQPTGGLIQNPTFGLFDSIHGASRQGLQTALQGESYTSADLRGLSRAFNVLHNYPGMQQFINATSQGLSSD